MVPSPTLNRSSWILTLASIAVVIGALYLAKGILLPLILAALISFLLSPVCDWLERRRLGRIPSVLITSILTFTGLGIIASTAIAQMGELAPKIAEYQGNIEAKVKSLTDGIGSTMRRLTKTTQKISEQLEKAERPAEPGDTGMQPYRVRLIASPPTALEIFGGMFGTLLEGLASAGIVIILVLFFLARREDLRDRFIRLAGQGEVTGTTQALQDAANRVSRYLLAQFLVNVAFGVATGIGLHWVGIPNATLWGILTAALKFIPYIGVWIAAIAPTCLSLAISTGWMQPILAFSVFAVLEFIVGNFVEPILFGKHTGVSAVAIMVAAVFWSWLWGGVGLLLATPLTVCLLVLGKHVPQLQFLDILLGDEPVFDWKTRAYQRLLAGDQEEAAELVEEYYADRSLVEIYDTVLIPVVYRAQQDRHASEIDVDRLDFILQSVRSMVDDLGEVERERDVVEPEIQEKLSGSLQRLSPPNKVRSNHLICVAAFTEADEVVGAMIAQLAEMRGLEVRIVSASEYTKAGDAAFDGVEADVVCISAMPPNAIARARTAFRKIRRRLPQAEIVVGLWNYDSDLVRAAKRLGCTKEASVVTTLQVGMESVLSNALADVVVTNDGEYATVVPALAR